MGLVTVQVFEQSTLRVGAALSTADGGTYALTAQQHTALGAFADATGDRYLSCGRRSVRLGSYVGLLQLGELSIEILPKADRNAGGDRARWHRALVRMLRVVGDLGLEAQDEASLTLEPGRLFELFIRRFVDECEGIVHEGLAKCYRTEESNRTTFRGRLRFADHVRRNAANAVCFYVAAPVYDYQNLPNLALVEALRAVTGLPVSAFARARAKALLDAFPALPRWRPDLVELQHYRPTRNSARYGRALHLARLILFDLAPDVRQGETPLLSLLFDMNTLWERFVAAVARRIRWPGLEVRTQDSRFFWRSSNGRRPLRPDITVRSPSTGEVVIVADSKWKLPEAGQPSSADIKQMFCYHELFECSRSSLIYPATGRSSTVPDRGRYEGRTHCCSLLFFDVEDSMDTLAELLLSQAR